MPLIPMMKPAPPQLKKRHPKPKAQRQQPAPPAGLTITSVVFIPATSELIVYFSGPIVWNGIDLPSEFKAFTEDGYFDSPTSVRGVGPDWIHFDFNAGAPPGSAWEVVGLMAGITPAVAWPQSGVVTP